MLHNFKKSTKLLRSFFFLFLFSLLPSLFPRGEKRGGNDRLSNSLTNCSREKVGGSKLVGEASKLISGKSGGVVSGDW